VAGTVAKPLSREICVGHIDLVKNSKSSLAILGKATFVATRTEPVSSKVYFLVTIPRFKNGVSFVDEFHFFASMHQFLISRQMNRAGRPVPLVTPVARHAIPARVKAQAELRFGLLRSRSGVTVRFTVTVRLGDQ
jgi:hypothetical protein